MYHLVKAAICKRVVILILSYKTLKSQVQERKDNLGSANPIDS